MPLAFFYTHKKYYNMFPRGIDRERWHEMGLKIEENAKPNRKAKNDSHLQFIEM